MKIIGALGTRCNATDFCDDRKHCRANEPMTAYDNPELFL
jgi:hypothetical protein